MTLAILFIGVMATVTFAATVARVNRVTWDTVKSRLVFKEISQLSERPIMQSCSLAFLSRDSLADMRQIFDSYSTALCLCLLNKSLTNYVIRITLKSTLCAGKLFEFALGRARTFALKITPTMGVLAASLINLLSAKWLSVAVSCDADYPQVNAQNILSIIKQRLINITNRVQVEVTLAINQICLALTEWQQLTLILPTLKRDCLSAFKRPDGHPLVFLERKNPIVIGDAAVLTKDALVFGVEFVGVRDFGYQPDDNLSRKAKGIFRVVIDEFMEVILLEYFTVPSLFASRIARLIRTLKGRTQEFSLLFGWYQLEINYQLHAAMIIQSFKYGRLRRLFESTIAVATHSSIA